MEHREVRDINVGKLAAENEPSLDQYFVETSVYRRVRLGHTKVLIGARGSGKSAIFRILAEREIENGTLVEQVTPNDYLYEVLKNSNKLNPDAEWKKFGAYTASWKYSILLTAMKLLYQKHRKLSPGSAAIKLIRNYLKVTDEEYEKSPLDLFLSFTEKFKNVKQVTLSGIQFGDNAATNTAEAFYNLKSIRHLFDPINTLSAKSKVIILFDELDHGWDASEDSRQFIASLFRAATQINKDFPNVHVLITIREEIFQNIPELYDDAQKTRDVTEYIRWTADDLKDMATRRIKHALELLLNVTIKDATKDNIWEMLFSKTVTTKRTPSFKYVIDRSTFRPRELIFFINECFKIHNMEKKLGTSTMELVERVYSKHRAQDIATEYRFQYPGLRELFETFHGKEIKWSRTDLEDHWLSIVEKEIRCPSIEEWLNDSSSPEQFISYLWKVSFLRVFAKTGRKPGSRDGRYYLGYYQEPSLNTEMYDHFDVHPMFHACLGMESNYSGVTSAEMSEHFSLPA